ncbi:MAG: sulfotransferase [Planctomycetia bacterium]
METREAELHKLTATGNLMPAFDRLFMISAWNDSGGAFTHRLFDGHPELFCWPFELQLGTDGSATRDLPWLRGKFRWPVFQEPLAAPSQLFDAILDTELKERLAFPEVSKFREYEMRVSLKDWRQEFCRRLGESPSRGDVVRCYMQTFFDVGTSAEATGRECGVVGHCPNIAVDADRIIEDFPEGRILHIVRSPLAGIVDMRRRNPLLTALEYGTRWNMINSTAGTVRRCVPERMRIVRLQDLVSETRTVMSELCEWLNISFDDVLLSPTWRGKPIPLTGPFGGLRGASLQYEVACARLVSEEDRRVLLECTAEARSILDLDVLTLEDGL